MLSLERRQLRRDREIGVQRERCAVEHQFVLAADLVEIDQRQPAFGDAGNRDRQPHIVLVARVRRAVGHDQDFRAGLGETFDDVFVFGGFLEPDVLADGHADPDAAHRYRARGGSAREHALFVEHAVIRQVGLEADRRDATAIEQRDRRCRVCRPRPRACRSASPGRHRRFRARVLRSRAAGRLECRLQHQILRRIAGDEQLRQHDEVGAVVPRSARAARALAALPATSPTVEFSWASVIANWLGGSVMDRSCLARAETAMTCFRWRPCARRWRKSRTARP